MIILRLLYDNVIYQYLVSSILRLIHSIKSDTYEYDIVTNIFSGPDNWNATVQLLISVAALTGIVWLFLKYFVKNKESVGNTSNHFYNRTWKKWRDSIRANNSGWMNMSTALKS